MFPRLEYLEWIEGRPAVALYDLGSSDVRGGRGHEPELVPGPLRELDDPPVGATVELQLAQEYSVNPEQVLVTTGATTANMLAAAAAVQTASEGDESDAAAARILVEKPGYEPLVKTPAVVAASVDRFLRGDDNEIAVDRVVAALTEDTELVTITNRHNPSGFLADRDTLADLAAAVRDAGARLLVDEVYAPYSGTAPDGEQEAESGDGRDGDQEGRAFGGVTAAGLEGALVTGSLTKFYGFGGLSIGWLVGDESFVQTARHIEPHIGGVADPSRVLARRALHHTEQLGARSRKIIQTNAEALERFVDDRDDIQGRVEPGCSYAFLDPVGVDGDAVSEAAWEAGVLVVPGRFFDDPERVRLSLCGDPETMVAGLEAFGDVLDSVVEGDARQTEA